MWELETKKLPTRYCCSLLTSEIYGDRIFSDAQLDPVGQKLSDFDLEKGATVQYVSGYKKRWEGS